MEQCRVEQRFSAALEAGLGAASAAEVLGTKAPALELNANLKVCSALLLNAGPSVI